MNLSSFISLSRPALSRSFPAVCNAGSTKPLRYFSSHHIHQTAKVPAQVSDSKSDSEPGLRITRVPSGNSTGYIPNVTKTAVQIKTKLGPLDRKPLLLTYPAFWLRDHCLCSECQHPETKQRLLNTFSIHPGVFAKKVRYGTRGVFIEWSGEDAHESYFPFTWLQKHEFGKQTTTYPSAQKWKHVAPGSKHPYVEYGEVMETDGGVAEWTRKIYVNGYCFVNNVPATPEATQALLERIAFIRHTHYGGFWDFTSDLAMKDTAYTNLGLPLHTDTAYFTDPCGLQLFHVLSHEPVDAAAADEPQDLGGHNTMCDGYAAANYMQHEHPSYFRILSETPIPYHSSGNEDVSIRPLRTFPVFSEAGHRLQIRWNNDDRATKTTWTPNQMSEWYMAAALWAEIIASPAFMVETKLEPGKALIFDNWRMLHGRTPFTGKRRMCGGYISHDDFMSRFKILNQGREEVLLEI